MNEVFCPICLYDGERVVAEFVGAQSTDAGKTVTWIVMCANHADGWNLGGDWPAPVFELGRRRPDLETDGYDAS